MLAGLADRACLGASSSASPEASAAPSAARSGSGRPSHLVRQILLHARRADRPSAVIVQSTDAADQSLAILGAHSADAAPTRNSRWETPLGIDTSDEQESHCGNAGSPDISGRFPGEERCRFAQKIPLLLHPRQFALELG